MDLDITTTLTNINMKDSFILIANMEKVPFNIQMVPSIMENG
jgi:hypothetical protein